MQETLFRVDFIFEQGRVIKTNAKMCEISYLAPQVHGEME